MLLNLSFIILIRLVLCDLERRIVDGKSTSIKPWMVFLRCPEIFCGGVLYTKSLVITAAHCNAFDVKDWKVYIGVKRVKPRIVHKEFFSIILRKNHDNYVDGKFEYDVSVWWINGKSNERTQVVLDEGTEILNKKKEIIVIGWGNKKRITHKQRKYFSFTTSNPVSLQMTKLPLVSDLVCFNRYPEEFDSDIMFCTGLGKSGSCASLGDSGGPVYRKNSNNIILMGIVSFSGACGYKDFYNVNTKISTPSISKFIDFYVKMFKPQNIINGKPEILIYPHSPKVYRKPFKPVNYVFTEANLLYPQSRVFKSLSSY